MITVVIGTDKTTLLPVVIAVYEGIHDESKIGFDVGKTVKIEQYENIRYVPISEPKKVI